MTLGLSPNPPRQMAPMVIPQDRPVYQITAEKGFFGPDDHLYATGAVIAWLDEPNTEMEPLNEMATAAMKKYLQKLDACGRAVAEKAGRAYTGLEDAFDNSRALEQQDAKRVQLIGEKEMVPLMGAKKRGPKRVEVVEMGAPAEVPMTLTKGKHSLNGRNEVNKTMDVSKGFL